MYLLAFVHLMDMEVTFIFFDDADSQVPDHKHPIAGLFAILYRIISVCE